MISAGQLIGEGSWNLRVFITDLQVERYLRVKGDVHIGGVMLRLVDEMDISMDWSDHALWWPDRNLWLTRTRSTLDQCGVQADSYLHFTPMHKNLRVQLPDLRYLDCRVDFSIKTFNAVVQLCKEFGIRHPEELSFCKPLDPFYLKNNYQKVLMDRSKNKDANSNHVAPDTNTFIANTSNGTIENGSMDRKTPFMCAPITPTKPPPSSTPVSSPAASTWTNGYGPDISAVSLLDGEAEHSLANTPSSVGLEAKKRLLKPKSLIEKARLNVAWLDSSLSIMEQGVREFDTLHLRFKFYSFYDLNPKFDAVRINQIYEQAKWQILNEEVDCTEEEGLMFAALQVQAKLQMGVPQPEDTVDGEDDIDAALSELQVTLEGSHIYTNGKDITHVPELHDYLRFLKPKRFTLKAFKRYWVSCRDLRLRFYKTMDDWSSGAAPLHNINLVGCEITPELSLAQSKFAIKLEVPGPEGMSEVYLKCENEEQYARWLAACRLAAKGRSLADSSYEGEVASIKSFLQLQHPSPSPAIPLHSLDICPEEFLPPRILKKLKLRAVSRILEAHANVKEISLIESKLNYIKAWQSLPDFGVSYFLVRFMGQKKDELLGITHNKIMKMDLSGDHVKTWRYNTMKAWNVNWEVKHMMVQFDEENIIFMCLTADCKVIHEFIGGYLFLSMRSKEVNQSLNEELFHKLTGGWV